ncbi:MAG: 2-octaprenylphenol hydroxylase, partial [Acidovorax sp. 32-64-7]
MRPDRSVSAARLPDRPPQRSALRRATQIAMALTGFLLWVAWHRGLMRCDTHRAAERFAQVLQRLGTTFVKLGQHLSLRADVLPPDAQRALASLQAHVAPFSSEQAVQEVEAALGRPWQEVFARFDMQALAAASIAQIHRAALPDGTEVVVKIRRPGAAEQAETDMRILRRLVLAIQWFVPSLRRWGLAAIVDEVAANFRYEMDLSREASSVRRFADAWRDSPDIVLPDVVDELCTSTVMVQQFSRGAHLHGLPPAMGAAAAGKLVDSYIVQIFRDGFFHGDPHPGNVFVMDDGRICLHDFGIVGRVDRSMRRALVAFALAFVEQDADWVVDAWLDLGLVGEGT